MKFLKLLSLFTLLLTISCADDDNSTNEQGTSESTDNSILGTWKIIESSEDGIDDQLGECLLRETLEFKENNILENISPFFNNSLRCELDTLTGSFVINDSRISLRGIDLIQENYEFTITANRLTLIDDEDTDSLIVEVYERQNQ